jgi:hypothetical protein
MTVARTYRRRAGALLLACAASFGLAADAAQDFSVRAERRDGAVKIEASVTLSAPRELIWATLTDYDHLAEFVPGMRVSRIIGRRGPAAIVEQEGEAGFLIFSYPIKVVVESAEYPPSDIEIHVVAGNLHRLDGRYRLEEGERDGTWVLRWSGLIEPSLPIPSFLSARILRDNVEAQFFGMVTEIERRQAVSGPSAAFCAILRTATCLSVQ